MMMEREVRIVLCGVLNVTKREVRIVIIEINLVIMVTYVHVLEYFIDVNMRNGLRCKENNIVW